MQFTWFIYYWLIWYIYFSEVRIHVKKFSKWQLTKYQTVAGTTTSPFRRLRTGILDILSWPTWQKINLQSPWWCSRSWWTTFLKWSSSKRPSWKSISKAMNSRLYNMPNNFSRESIFRLFWWSGNGFQLRRIQEFRYQSSTSSRNSNIPFTEIWIPNRNSTSDSTKNGLMTYVGWRRVQKLS